MHNYTIIIDLLIILLVSLPIIFLFNKIKLPSIVGFLVAGMIIGPSGLQLIDINSEIEVMAEIGVILLLFTIGLEISLKDLLKSKEVLIFGGLMQVGFTIIISAILFIASGIDIKKSIFFGMLISLSSTAIVLKLLVDKQQIETPHGKISVGITIFQDLAIVPMILMIPLLSEEKDVSILSVLIKLSIAFLILSAVVVLAKVLMPKIIFQLAKLRIREAFTIGIILIVLGTAYVTELIGLSLALGAFIAGLILSETDYNYQVISDILPLRDAFNSVFFVSVGLLLDLSFVRDFFPLVIGISFGIIIVKSLVIILSILILRFPIRIAIITGLSLAQIGEFSFVFAQFGVDANLMLPDYYNAFLASTIFTMILTPVIFSIAPKVAEKFKDIKSDDNKDSEKLKELQNHVVIVGFGLNGKNLARVLKETGIEYVILELNPVTVKTYKLKNEEIYYGDATREEVLLQTNIKSAKLIVFVISDNNAVINGIKIAKKLNPKIFIIVRTRFIMDVDKLHIAGADLVIPEEFETSLEIFSRVLQQYHIPPNIILKQRDILRGEAYQFLRLETPEHPLSHLRKILAAGLTESFYVEETNPHIGKNLIELNLRHKTNTTIIAIVRSETVVANPSPTEIIMAGDSLIITGNHLAVDNAINYLSSIN